MITSIFRKATFRGVFSNFNSFLPVAYKFGLVYTLLHRCFQICSTYEKFHEKIVLLKDIFKRNEYPKAFIDKCITNFLNKLFVSKKIVHTSEKKQVLIVLPFLGPLSFEIRSRLQKCLKSYIPYCSLKVVYQSKNRLFSVSQFKDKIADCKLSSHLVYTFLCSYWNATYYGQTQRHIFVRACEHLATTLLTDKPIEYPKNWSHIVWGS